MTSTHPTSTDPGSTWRYRPTDHPDILPVRTFNDNYVWMIRLQTPHGRQALVVDPGDGGPVIDALSQAGLPLAGILVTHHHADHTGGIAALKEAFPEAVVHGPQQCRNPLIERRYRHGDTVALPELGFEAQVIDVPGHTLDHNAYFCERIGADPRPVVFCGDTLFAAGCGRLFEGTAPVMFESLSRLAALPAATLVYCAHEYTLSNLRFARAVEPASNALSARIAEAEALRKQDRATVPSTVAIERDTNPFLRARESQVAANAAAFDGSLDAADPVAVFAALRRWKDEFRG